MLFCLHVTDYGVHWLDLALERHVISVKLVDNGSFNHYGVEQQLNLADFVAEAIYLVSQIILLSCFNLLNKLADRLLSLLDTG